MNLKREGGCGKDFGGITRVFYSFFIKYVYVYIYIHFVYIV